MSRIRSSLTPELREAFDAEVRVVRPHVEGLSRDEAVGRLGASMKQLFEQSFELDGTVAEALARVATEARDEEGPAPTVDELAERCALQRALVRVGFARGLAPYFAAVGDSARNVLTLSADAFAEGGYIGRDAPVLPAVHSQDTSLEHARPSTFFEERHV